MEYLRSVGAEEVTLGNRNGKHRTIRFVDRAGAPRQYPVSSASKMDVRATMNARSDLRKMFEGVT